MTPHEQGIFQGREHVQRTCSCGYVGVPTTGEPEPCPFAIGLPGPVWADVRDHKDLAIARYERLGRWEW